MCDDSNKRVFSDIYIEISFCLLLNEHRITVGYA